MRKYLSLIAVLFTLAIVGCSSVAPITSEDGTENEDGQGVRITTDFLKTCKGADLTKSFYVIDGHEVIDQIIFREGDWKSQLNFNKLLDDEKMYDYYLNEDSGDLFIGGFAGEKFDIIQFDEDDIDGNGYLEMDSEIPSNPKFNWIARIDEYGYHTMLKYPYLTDGEARNYKKAIAGLPSGSDQKLMKLIEKLDDRLTVLEGGGGDIGSNNNNTINITNSEESEALDDIADRMKVLEDAKKNIGDNSDSAWDWLRENGYNNPSRKAGHYPGGAYSLKTDWFYEQAKKDLNSGRRIPRGSFADLWTLCAESGALTADQSSVVVGLSLLESDRFIGISSRIAKNCRYTKGNKPVRRKKVKKSIVKKDIQEDVMTTEAEKEEAYDRSRTTTVR